MAYTSMSIPDTVYVVHIEWENSLEGGNSEIWGVFANKEDAVAAQLDAIDEYQNEDLYGGLQAYYDPRTEERSDDWDFDVHITKVKVQ